MTPEEQFERDGQAHFSARRYDKALECVHSLQELGRNETRLRVYEAQCLYYLRRAPEAIAVMRELLAKDPEHPDYNVLLAQYLRAIGAFDESLQYLEKVPTDLPGYAMLMAWHQLRLGNFLEGSRLFQKESGAYQIDERFHFPHEKRLRPGMDIHGKTVLLGFYGGFGDEIIGARFAPMLERRGARVIVGSSQPSLIDMLRDMPSLRDVCDNRALIHTEYDYYLPSIDAIDFLGITDPKKDVVFPYLIADVHEVVRWAPVLAEAAGGKPKIGIHWQANWEFDSTEMKSVPAELMMRFAECGALFSLQRDAGANTLPRDAHVFDTETGAPSWKSTVAVMRQMEYVVTNDSAIAHLAGALGVKTAVLLPHAPHHYWLPLGIESLWYPNVRLFRQPRYDDWEGGVQSALIFIQKDRSL